MERFHHFWWYSPGIPWGFSHILLFSPPIRRFAWHARVWSRRHGTPRYSRNAAEPLGFGWEMVAFDGFWGWVASFASFGGGHDDVFVVCCFFCPPPQKKKKTKGFQHVSTKLKMLRLPFEEFCLHLPWHLYGHVVLYSYIFDDVRWYFKKLRLVIVASVSAVAAVAAAAKGLDFTNNP